MQFEKELPQLVISCVRQLATATHVPTLREQLLWACLVFMDHAHEHNAETVQVCILCYIGWTRCHSAAYACLPFGGNPISVQLCLDDYKVFVKLLQNVLLSAVTLSKIRLKVPSTFKAYIQLKAVMYAM